MLCAIYGSIWETSQIHFFPQYVDFYGPFSSSKIQQTIKNIHFYFKIKVFWWNEAVEVIEVTEAVEAVEVIEAI